LKVIDKKMSHSCEISTSKLQPTKIGTDRRSTIQQGGPLVMIKNVWKRNCLLIWAFFTRASVLCYLRVFVW